MSTGLLFIRLGDQTISYQDGGRSFHGHWATEYVAAKSSQEYPWGSDIAQGLHGSFLIGAMHRSNLWRVKCAQADHLGRLLFTLMPVKPVAGLPQPDFSVINDEVIRTETEKAWDDMVHALSGDRMSAVVKSAKQVAENVLYFGLLKMGQITPGNYDFAELLARLKSTLEDRLKRQLCSFTDLDYHLMQKLRILHGGTHIGRVVVNGRAASKEYGASVTLDLVEILTSFGAVT